MTLARESEIISSVLDFGQSSTCFLTTYPGFQHFEYRSPHGITRISYIDTPTAWVGASEPIGPKEDWQNALLAYIRAAGVQKKVALLLPISKSFAEVARSLGLCTIQIGQEPWYRLNGFLLPKIAKQLENKGAKVETFDPAHLPARERLELEEITNRWLDSRKSAPLDFLNQVKPWIHIQHKRYFRVILNGHQLGYLSAIPIPARKAWYLIDLIRVPSAPLGTTELLIYSAVHSLANEGAREMTLGMSPLAPVGEQEVHHHPKLYSLFNFVFERMSFFYNFKTLFQYKEKLKPNTWEPLYLMTSEKSFGLKSSLGVSQAIFPKGIVFTSLLTLKKLAQRIFVFPTFNRLMSNELVLRSTPKHFIDLLIRLRITLSIAVTNILFFFVSTTPDFKLRDGARDRFQFNLGRYLSDGFGVDDGRTLFLHSFLHWNLFHLLFNVAVLLIFVGYLEVIAGSMLVFTAYVLGVLFSNPITAILIESFLRRFDPMLALEFIRENDVGCSLGVFAGLGTLSYFLKKPQYFLIALTVGTLIVSFVNNSILGLNHLVSLVIGYGVGRKYVRKNEN